MLYSMQLCIMTLKGGEAMALGDRIKRLRERKRMTQAELAERVGVNQALISRLESKVTASTNTDVLRQLALTLGCTTDYLVGMYAEEESEAMAAAMELVAP